MKFAYHATMCPPDEYLPLALAAEQAGFDTFTFPDSICYPQEGSDVYPYNDDGTRDFLDARAGPRPRADLFYPVVGAAILISAVGSEIISIKSPSA